ncbi:MAG: CD1107 family mobile element protein [Lachnospiraceae bacterium]
MTILRRNRQAVHSVENSCRQPKSATLSPAWHAIQVNGTVYDHTSLTNGRLELSLKQYADAYEQLLVQAVDRVGNTSKAAAPANVLFPQHPVTTPGNAQTPPRLPSNNVPAVPAIAPLAAPTAEPAPCPTAGSATAAPGTEIERGLPFSGRRQFLPPAICFKLGVTQVTTAYARFIEDLKFGDLFYMIIDYDKPLDEKGEKYETYFLNLVDSRDLLDIVDAKDIPDEPEVIYVAPEPDEVPTQSPPKRGKS